MIEATGVEPFMLSHGAFTDGELDSIVAYGDALRQADATIKGDMDRDEPNSIRITRIAWIEQKSEVLWLYEKMAAVAWSLNEQSYRFELAAVEKLQYTVYTGGEGSH